jgi:hypothetical protein
MGENPILIAQSIGIIISISCFNATGVAITKYASAAQRSTVDTCRTLLIWLISLALKSEKFDVPYSFGQLAGFVALVCGTLIYNEIWVLPCESLNKNTKANREGRDMGGILDGDKPSAGYLASSPAALYDSQRNKRNIESRLNERGKLIHSTDDSEMNIKGLATNDEKSS